MPARQGPEEGFTGQGLSSEFLDSGSRVERLYAPGVPAAYCVFPDMAIIFFV